MLGGLWGFGDRALNEGADVARPHDSDPLPVGWDEDCILRALAVYDVCALD
jgi:hypothetical protein